MDVPIRQPLRLLLMSKKARRGVFRFPPRHALSLTPMTDLSTTAGKLADLRARLSETEAPLGEEAQSQRHSEGLMTARERIGELLDEGSFVEIDALARHRATDYGMDATRPVTDGVITGYGTIQGRKVCVYSQDATIFDGALGEVYGEKMVKLIELATRTGVPLIGFSEGAGARVAEGLLPLGMFARISRLLTQASGIIPHICILSGEASGAHAIAPALADVLVMLEGSSALQLTPNDVVASVTGIEEDSVELAGGSVHAHKSGLCHRVVSDDHAAIRFVHNLFGYLPQNNRAEAPRTDAEIMQGAINANITPRDRELDEVIPDSINQPFNVMQLIDRLVDNAEFLEIQDSYAPNVICGFARVEGRAVGIIANQPEQLAGCLDSKACRKAARFIRTCDTFNLPIIEIVDVPGFLPAKEEEQSGVQARAAALAYAYAEASVGKITVIVRRAMGAAYTVMGAKDLGADLVFAWPTAEIAAADATIASTVLNTSEEDYSEKHLNPYRAAELGMVDAVIPPAETRGHIIEGLRLLDRKTMTPPARKHGNMPL